MNKVIAIDIGGTFIKHGLINEDGDVLSSRKTPSDKSGACNFINQLCDVIKSYNSEEDVKGVAISMTGLVNSKEGIILCSGTFKFIENYNIKGILEARTGLRVVVENDANSAALAEKFNGNAVECDDFVCITIGTGVGGGIYLNGDLFRGKQFRGGEFWCMITKDKENYQTLSQNASMTALINMYKDYKNIDKDEEISGEQIFREAENDESVKDVIKEWYGNIARMIYNISSILDPEKILIGGGISAREDLMSELLVELEKIPDWDTISCPIEKCKHKNNAGLIGSAYYFYNSI